MKKYWNRHFLSGICFLLLPTFVWAEAPVQDAVPISSSDPEVPLSQDNSARYSSPSSFNPNNPASLLSKMNEMQSEIQRLRGQLEVQSHELAQLKEQQQAYYNDLDQRVTLLSSGKKPATLAIDDSPSSATSATTDTQKAAGAAVAATALKTPLIATTSGGDEESSYNAAYALIESKQFPQATSAMKNFILKYPNGKYASNAHYWLGELLIATHQDQEAISEFNTVIQQFPTSNKVSPSMLKLGFAYANLGDIEKARATLSEVESKYPGTTSAQLASARLETLR